MAGGLSGAVDYVFAAYELTEKSKDWQVVVQEATNAVCGSSRTFVETAVAEFYQIGIVAPGR